MWKAFKTWEGKLPIMHIDNKILEPQKLYDALLVEFRQQLLETKELEDFKNKCSEERDEALATLQQVRDRIANAEEKQRHDVEVACEEQREAKEEDDKITNGEIKDLNWRKRQEEEQTRAELAMW